MKQAGLEWLISLCLNLGFFNHSYHIWSIIQIMFITLIMFTHGVETSSLLDKICMYHVMTYYIVVFYHSLILPYVFLRRTYHIILIISSDHFYKFFICSMTSVFMLYNILSLLKMSHTLTGLQKFILCMWYICVTDQSVYKHSARLRLHYKGQK